MIDDYYQPEIDDAVIALQNKDEIIADLQKKLAKAIEGYHWIAEKNRFVDTGSKNKATVMLSILENKEKENG